MPFDPTSAQDIFEPTQPEPAPQQQQGFDPSSATDLSTELFDQPRRQPYQYIEPEGDTETIQFESTGEVMTAPAGTGRTFSEIENDTLFDAPSGTFETAGALFEKQSAYIALALAAYDLLPDDEASQFIAQRSRAFASAQEREPEYMREWRNAVLNAPGPFSATAITMSRPAALGREVITQSANSIIPLISTWVGAKTGAATGTGIALIGGQLGPQAAAPEELVTVPVAAGLGGTIGGVGGAFVGTTALETAATLDQIMVEEYGADMTNAETILNILSNPTIMADLKRKAERKGVTTGAVDAMFQVFGGRFLKIFAGQTAGKRVAAGVADVATQSVGEAAGEAAGQYAAFGEVNWNEAVLEGMTSLAQSGGQTAIGATSQGTVRGAEIISEKVKEFRADPSERNAIDVFTDTMRNNVPIGQRFSDDEAIDLVREKFLANEKIEENTVPDYLKAAARDLNSELDAAVQEQRFKEGRGYAPVPREPKSLIGFIRDQGGIKDEGGDLIAMGVKDVAPGVIRPKVGQSPDTILRAAQENGYIINENADINTLLDAIGEEIRGNKTYRAEDAAIVAERQEAVDFNAALDEYVATTLDAKDYKSTSVAMKDAARAARNDTKAAQESIINILEGSPLSANDKSKFLRAVKNIQSTEQLNRALPRITKRVDALLEAQAVRDTRRAISKNLKKTKTTKQSGRRKGKFTPRIQELLDELRRVDKLTKEQANEELAIRFANLGDDIPDRNARLINSFLAAKGEGSDASSATLRDLAIEVQSIIQAGRSQNIQAKLDRDQIFDEAKDQVLTLIGNVQAPSKFTSLEGVNDFLRDQRTGFGNWVEVFESKLRRAFDSSDAKAVDGFIENNATLFEENRKFVKGRQERVQELNNLITEKAGITEKELHKKLLKDSSKKIYVGEFVHSDGVTRRIRMTKAELRKRNMEFRDETLRETLFDDEKGNRYTEEIENAMEAALDPVDMAIIDAQMEFYRGYYDDINEVYERLYGVRLPRLDNYSPISRNVFDTNTNEFLKSLQVSGTIAPGSTKERVNSRAELKTSGDFDVIFSHIYEMEYFISHAEKVRDMRRLFGDTQVQKVLRDKQGDAFVRSINDDLNYFNGKGRQGGTFTSRTLNQLVRNFGFAQLAAKPQIGLKQLTSFPAFVSGVKTKDFAAGLVEFAKNPRKALQTLNDSEFFEKRGYDIDKDFKAMIEDKHFLNFMGKNPGMLRFMMLPIKYGDKGAIAIGGYAHYHAQRKAGLSHKEALNKMSRLANKTQQSSDTDQQTALQRQSDPISNLLTQFMSSPNALLRAEMEAFTEFSKGRISKSEFMKRFFIYHIFIPNIFLLASNGFQFDEEDIDDHITASVIGSFTGWFLIGDLLEYGASKAITGSAFRPKIRHPGSVVEDAVRFTEYLSQGDVSLDDFWEGSKAINSGLDATGGITGLPAKTLYNEMLGIKDIYEGDTEEGIYRMLGYSPWLIDNKIVDKQDRKTF